MGGAQLIFLFFVLASIYSSASFIFSNFGGRVLPPRNVMRDSKTSLYLAIVFAVLAGGIGNLMDAAA